jgi:segregation and condensation protein B
MSDDLAAKAASWVPPWQRPVLAPDSSADSGVGAGVDASADDDVDADVDGGVEAGGELAAAEAGAALTAVKTGETAGEAADAEELDETGETGETTGVTDGIADGIADETHQAVDTSEAAELSRVAEADGTSGKAGGEIVDDFSVPQRDDGQPAGHWDRLKDAQWLTVRQGGWETDEKAAQTDQTDHTDQPDEPDEPEQAVEGPAVAMTDHNPVTDPVTDEVQGGEDEEQEQEQDQEQDQKQAQAQQLGRAEMVAALEAILMIVDEPVSEITLAQVLEVPAEQVAGALIDLAVAYTRQGRGFDLRRAAGGWRFYTRAEYASYVEKFVLDGQQVRLTQASLETLAVIAYKQPVTRSRISAIRGVNCDGVVRTLMARGLIEECGSDPDSGAHLYRTTTLFLEKLGLDSVEQLPPLAPFLPDNLEEVANE